VVRVRSNEIKRDQKGIKGVFQVMSTKEKAASDNPSVNEAGSQHAQAKTRLASHPDAKPETLDKLSHTSDVDLTQRVAENVNTSPATLDKLANHDSSKVRIGVADNLSTPADVIEVLAHDENPDVRYRVAENPDTPVAILENLAADSNPYVVARAEETLERVQSISERADDLMLKEHYAEAEELYRKLVTGLEEYLGPQHPEVGKALHKLAAVLVPQKREDEAKELELRANAINNAKGEIS
jgi:hypothetical protein